MKTSLTTRHSAEVARLEEIVSGKLPERVTKDIQNLKLTVNEMAEWNESRAPFHLEFTARELKVDVKLRLSTKKVIALLGTIGGGLWLILSNLDKLALLGKALASIFGS